MPDRVAILYRDDALIAIDKPAGLAVHRGWADDDTYAMTEVRDAIGAWVYPVHRLDRGASGVLVFALSSDAARELAGKFEHGQVDKRYRALVRGAPPEHVVIDHPIPRRPDGPRVPAVTEVRVLERFGRYSWIEAAPRTGRLHQIRRHLKHISCPLIGDVRYGKGPHNRLFREHYGLHRLALHASSLAIGTLRIEAPVPADLAGALAKLRAS